MKEVVIAGYLRTAQTRARPNDPGRDLFGKMRADDLLAQLLPAVVEQTGIKPEDIDDFLVGSALGVNEQWSFGGRTPIFLANFPETISAKFVDQQCGSAMAGVHIAFMEVAMGFADTVMVGGTENMTRVPMGAATFDKGHIDVNKTLMEGPAHRHWDLGTAFNMGLTAEKLLGMTDFTREDMDKWGVRSHQLAMKAREEGFFDGEIYPIEAEQANGEILTVKTDQAVRADASLEGMAALRPAFRKDGAVTPGNSSPLNSAASCLILMSKEAALKKGVKPLAIIRSIGFAGVDPTLMGLGPVPATQKALKSAGLAAGDIDYWEINEAFSIVALNCIKELGLNPDTVNVMGGGVAIGHPLGASGVRLTGTLSRILEQKGARFGCANMCCGGGQGVATILERYNS